MTTYITFVLDETGSMVSVKNETITGFNDYIKTMRKELDGEDIKFSLMKFNSIRKDFLFLDVGLFDVPELSNINYIPSSFTPLYDAFGYALQQMETKDLSPDDKVIITVLTDGEENSSRDFTAEQVKSMIGDHPDWQISFLGADIDAWATGSTLGLTRGQTYSYDNTDTIGTYTIMSDAHIQYAKGNTQNISLQSEDGEK